jgi:UDP:flavonoid glycosyltransferase YjiC (YdhE family)
MTQKNSIAFFISPHGYGHAARSCAVIQQIGIQQPGTEFHIFTLVPQWFFKDSLRNINFQYYPLLTDVGFVQKSPLQIDFEATLQNLAEFVKQMPGHVEQTASELVRLNCHSVVCDISPLGILAGEKSGIPVFLLENFTWDWMYEYYTDTIPEFTKYVNFFQEINQHIDYHLQAEPVSTPNRSSFTCAPICRLNRLSRQEIRSELNISLNTPVIMISTGGIATQHNFIEELEQLNDITFIIPNNAEQIQHHKNIIELPHHSRFYHPDLVNASDVVICKLGYSTIAEIYRIGLPVLYVSRKDFRESYPMSKWVNKNLPSLEISAAEFGQRQWLDRIPEMMDLKPRITKSLNGNKQATDFILKK